MCLRLSMRAFEVPSSKKRKEKKKPKRNRERKLRKFTCILDYGFLMMNSPTTSVKAETFQAKKGF